MQELIDEHFGANVEHVCLVLVEDVQGTDRKDRQEKWGRHFSWVEGCRVEEGQVVMEQVEVRLQETVQCVQAGKMERLQ